MKRRMPSSHQVALALIASACLLVWHVSLHSAARGGPKEHKSVYAALAEVPEKVRARRNPLENDPDAVAAGRKLFEEHCAECHGMAAEGGSRGPSLRAPEVQRAAPGALFWIVTNGVVRRGMPVWHKLPAPERWQIVAFLKSLQGSWSPRGPLARRAND
jgi:mono/diheme cytochrome c family protein